MKNTRQINNLLSEATIATTIEVVVEELCNNTVPSTPIIRPANGFEMTLFDEKVSPEYAKIVSVFEIIIDCYKWFFNIFFF